MAGENKAMLQSIFFGTSMGNTSSSSNSNTLRRNKSAVISRPRNLGSVLPVGNESNATRSQISLGRRSHDFLSSRNSRTDLQEREDDSLVRRAQSANAVVENATLVVGDNEIPLAAPPPYSEVIPQSGNASTSQDAGDLLQIPSSANRPLGHRRSASYSPRRSNPELRVEERRSTEPVNVTRPPADVKRELGYGVGQGLQLPDLPSAEAVNEAKSSVGSRHAHVIMLPPRTNASSSRVDLRSDSPTPRRHASIEDPLESLRRYNVVFIIDDSSSMAVKGWTTARKVVSSLVEIASKYDTNGVDIHFLNSTRAGSGIRTATSTKRLFDAIQPSGVSLIAAKLEELLQEYLSVLENAKRDREQGRTMSFIKPVNFIIFTDGIPTDDPEPVIVQAARRLDVGNFSVTQIGIQFVQLGSDTKTFEVLRELDDDISKTYGVRDIVDATSIPSNGELDEDTVVKILLGGINRRVDNKGARSVLA